MRAASFIPLALLLGLTMGLACDQAHAGLDAAPDLSIFATKEQLSNVVPQSCSGAPAADTLNGTSGSATCFVPRDATRPTAVQAANITTDSTGAWAVTWARPFASSMPVVNPLPANAGTLPILCNVATPSAVGASGKCWQSTATTLPATIAAVLGLVVSPFGTPASNAAVMVIAREPTQ